MNTEHLHALDRQIKDLSDWILETRSVPAYVKAQAAEIRATLKLVWEEIDPSAFGEGLHCGTVAVARHHHLPKLSEKDQVVLKGAGLLLPQDDE